MGWTLLATAIFVAAALQSAVQLALAAPGREASFLNTREAEGVHLAMNAAMAFMLTPAYGVESRRFLTAGFVVAIVLLIASLGLHQRAQGWALSRRARTIGVGYHVLMLAAMVYAMFLMAPATMPSGAMAKMSGGMPGMGMAPAAQPWLSLARGLGLVFALDAAVGAVAVTAFPRALIESERRGRGDARAAELDPAADRRLVRQLRVGLLPHLVMDLGMTWMLISG